MGILIGTSIVSLVSIAEYNQTGPKQVKDASVLLHAGISAFFCISQNKKLKAEFIIVISHLGTVQFL